jgi:hypothetical protein
MRLRIIMPVLSVLLGVLLFHIGDQQAEKILAKAPHEEALPEAAATARYVHYALNAPAWALVGSRDLLWSPSTYWTGRDLRYFVVVGVLWFLIGVFLDRRLGGVELPSQHERWMRPLACTCVGYGLFIVYSMLPPKPYSEALRNYLFTLPNTVRTSWAWWWYLPAAAWGLALVSLGFRALLQRRESRPEMPASAHGLKHASRNLPDG